MTRQIYTCIILMLIANFLFATHNRAGEIEVKQLGYLQYEAIIKTYTKESSINADRNELEICWGDGVCEWVERESFMSLDNDTKFNRYTIQYTYLSEGNYTISMTDLNRNGGIVNINPPSSNVAFHIETRLEVNSLINSPPVFLNPPTEFGAVGLAFYHTLGAVDLEGDSLGYELVVPLQAIGIDVPLYKYPDEIAPGASNNISLDPETGLFSWLYPQVQGAYVITIQVNEYRDGELLSSTIRDMQFEIGSFEVTETINDLPGDDFNSEDGDNINFNFAVGEDNGEELKISVFGHPFLLDNPASVEVPNDFTTGIVEGTFSWDVLEEHAEFSPYNITFRIDKKIDNNIYTTYHIVKVVVNAAPLSVDFVENNLFFEIFPNPIFGKKVSIKLPDLTSPSLRINTYTLQGKLIFEKQVYLSEETYPLDISSLKTGTYLIRIESGGKTGMKKLVIP